MNSILEQIARQKSEEVAQAKKTNPLNTFINEALEPQRDFVSALRHPGPAVIAEIKKASPSKGVIREQFDVAEIAQIYAQNGARCLSILTDMHFFQGHPAYLAVAKQHSTLPLLRKDFIIDAYQIYESAYLTADCILLIVAMLDDAQLYDYCQLAQELGMAVLVESHDQHELERALRLPTPLMGINNRNLHTFKTDTQLSIELQPYIPEDRILISESGINTPEDIKRMQLHNINTFLIGERLMRAEDMGAALRHLIRE